MIKDGNVDDDINKLFEWDGPAIVPWNSDDDDHDDDDDDDDVLEIMGMMLMLWWWLWS